MQCPKCGKESNNLRVCPYCHTQYPDEPAKPRPSTPLSSFAVAPQAQAGARASGSVPRVTGSQPVQPTPGFFAELRDTIARQSPAVRWGTVAVIVAFAAWYVFAGRERSIPNGVVLPEIVVSPMTRGEAEAVIKRMSETGQVDEAGAELAVHFPAATFPELRSGQLALAQRYASADVMVHGSKRVIAFYDPDGKVFARFDPSKGAMMVR